MKLLHKALVKFILPAAIILFLTGCPALAAPLPDPVQSAGDATGIEQVFTDVPAGNSNSLFINYLTKRGILAGYPDGTFRPQASLTRAQAAVVMCRAAGIVPAAGQLPFRDVSGSHWASGYIASARAAGLIRGYPDGTFRPDGRLTRAEAVTLILRLSKQPDTGVKLPDLTDIDSGHWAARAVSTGLAAGMVGLSADGLLFLPDALFKREDLARALGVLLTTDPGLSGVALTGVMKVLEGSASLQRGENTGEYAVNESTELKPGDVIVTGAGSAAQLSFPDGSSLRLGEKTEIGFNEARGRSYIRSDGTPGTAVDWLHIDLKSGKLHGALASRYETNTEPGQSQDSETGLKKFTRLAARGWQAGGFLAAVSSANAGQQQLPWYQAAKGKKVKVKVDMPWGVAAIKGTFWLNQVGVNGQSSTSVLIGDGEVTSGGQTVNLAAGQSTQVVSLEAPPEPPATLTTQQKVDFVLVREWIQEAARQIQAVQETVIAPPPPYTPPQEVLPVPPVSPTQVPVVPVTAVVPPVNQPLPPATYLGTSLTDLITTIITQTRDEVINYLPPEFLNPPTSSGGGGGGSSSPSYQPSPTLLNVIPITVPILSSPAPPMVAYLTDIYGNYMDGKTVTFYYALMGSSTYTTVGNAVTSGGKASLAAPAGLTQGEKYVCRAVFQGDGVSYYSEGSNIYASGIKNPFANMTVSRAEAPVGSYPRLVAYLADPWGVPVPNKDVTFYVDSNRDGLFTSGENAGTAYTDGWGKAVYQLSSAYPAGEYAIEARSPVADLEIARDTGVLVVTGTTTAPFLNAHFREDQETKTIIFEAWLNTGTATGPLPLAGKDITFQIDIGRDGIFGNTGDWTGSDVDGTDLDGQAYLELTGYSYSPGVYGCRVSFEGDGTYQPVSLTMPLQIGETKTRLAVLPVFNDNRAVAFLTDDAGNYISDEDIEFYMTSEGSVNYTYLGTVSTDSGKAAIVVNANQLTGLTAPYQCKAIFRRSGVYSPSMDKNIFYDAQEQPPYHLVFHGTGTKEDQNTTLQAFFVDKTGTGVDGEEIEFYLDSEPDGLFASNLLGEGITDTNGRALRQINGSSMPDPGEYAIRARVVKDNAEYFNDGILYVYPNVEPDPLDPQITDLHVWGKETIAYGAVKTIYLDIHLEGRYGPISGASLAIYADYNRDGTFETNFDPVMTDPDGDASFSYSGYNITTGDCAFKVEYGGNAQFSSAMLIMPVRIREATSLVVPEVRITSAGPVTLGAYLLDSGGLPLNGEAVEFRINNNTTRVITNPSGLAVLTYEPASTGDHPFKVIYHGSGPYAPTGSGSRLVVSPYMDPAQPSLTIGRTIFELDRPVKVPVYLTAGSDASSGVLSQIIKLYVDTNHNGLFDEGYIDAITNADGGVVFSPTGLAAGQAVIKAVYETGGTPSQVWSSGVLTVQDPDLSLAMVVSGLMPDSIQIGLDENAYNYAQVVLEAFVRNTNGPNKKDIPVAFYIDLDQNGAIEEVDECVGSDETDDNGRAAVILDYSIYSQISAPGTVLYSIKYQYGGSWYSVTRPLELTW